jgi:hypothetical protein
LTIGVDSKEAKCVLLCTCMHNVIFCVFNETKME